MTLVLLSLAVLGAAAVVALLSPRHALLAGGVGPAAALAMALRPIVAVLAGGPRLVVIAAWPAPIGPVRLELDALSAFFLLAILVLSALSGIFGIGYLGREAKTAGSCAFFFNLLAASMALVVLARQVVPFLLAWELMALTSFFLVAHHSERREVRQAAWTYLIATHLGALCLIPMFFILARAGGSTDFAAWPGALTPGLASACFLLAVVGFGTKAGMMPFHVWLPEAHPAAPSHVSALLSGVMIKTGIYGLLRIVTLLGEPQLWWGFLLLALGGVSALLGVLFALAQHDLKRLLAYHSVENIGIIVLGIGMGLVGLATGAPVVAGLGFAGALLHVLNHALFKGLLFLGAGSVLHATGTAELDELGGLARRMPVTAATFLVGSLAIAGLPPLNGFVSELLIYCAGLAGVTRLSAATAVPLGAAVAVLAAVGGLALACFVKAFGIVFLGEPRNDHGRGAHEAPATMRWPMIVLAAACFVIGLASAPAVLSLRHVVAACGVPAVDAALSVPARFLPSVSLLAGICLALMLGLALLRLALLRGRDVRTSPTWDCGYVAPAATMQYTASSFAQPIVDLYSSLLRTRKVLSTPETHFPDNAHLATETPDFGREEIYEPLFETLERALRRIRILQHGRLQVYVLGVVLTLVVLLLWQVR